MTKHTTGQKNKLEKMAQNGFRGYPIATVAFYGPNSKFATKVAVGIIADEKNEVISMEKWHSEDTDVRINDEFKEPILEFIKKYNAKTIVMSDGIMGCPHEEGIDYPKGESCPQCPYWENRDRFLDEVIH